ncbi:MAG: HD domain-containing protein [Oscillospiraceae bacterium]|nr:HD domain-containing protein [Oscillospiraceae bacterium]
MEEIKNYHHYKRDLLDKSDRIARLERHLMDLMLELNVADEATESSLVFDLKHQSNTVQFARVLARKRNLSEEICVAGTALHDIYPMTTGTYKNHAHAGTPIAEKILDEIGGFSKEEKEDILKIVYNHSDKHIWSDNPYEEFGKDVDILDCFLYPTGFGYYLKYKPLGIYAHYIMRAKKVWEELGLPVETIFTVLDNYNENWFDYSKIVDEAELLSILNNQSTPSFCFYAVGDNYKIFSNKQNWESIINGNRKQDDNSQLLELVKTTGNIALVWTVIDSYELIDPDSNRVEELGINKEEM